MAVSSGAAQTLPVLEWRGAEIFDAVSGDYRQPLGVTPFKEG
jgi:hypothetical protein